MNYGTESCSCAMTEILPGTTCTLPSCDGVEIDLITAGTGSHCIFDQTIPCKTGDIYVLRPQTAHAYGCDDGPMTVRRILLREKDLFDGDFSAPDHPRFCYGIFRDLSPVACATLNRKTFEEIEGQFRALSRELQEQKGEWKEVVKAYLSVLLITLSRYTDSAIKNPASYSPAERDLVQAALRTVNEAFASPSLTLESIARSLFVSKAHLSRLFKRGVGQPFSEYLRRVRMNRACRLLTETERSAEEILTACGLRDLPSFYRTFHEYTGTTPVQYRNLHKKEKIIDKKGEKLMIILSEISENLQKGKAKLVKEMVQAAIDEGANPSEILNEGLLAGMSVIGEKFKNNEVYVPEVLVAARAMNMGITVLKPHLVASGVQAVGKVCIGTVQGDLHDIGKNIVKMMLEGKGFEVVDLGTDVPAETFVQTAKEQGCQIICCSALLTTTMDVMADVVKAAEAAGIRDQVKIMVGGAPINQEFCAAIGADCYTVDAASAADAAVELCNQLKK
ncbi:MAG: cobalamin-dependent protein [Clostridia bacterium]|nr:cobalamin-dependent protein [Clostridia bacterium]